MDIQVPNDRLPNIIPLKFWEDYVEDTDKPGHMKPVEKVRWAKKGSGTGEDTSDKIARVQKDPALWTVIKPYYEAWKAGKDAPVSGTPLAAWPGVTPEQAEALRKLHIYTVEDMDQASDSALVKSGIPGARNLQIQARAFLTAQANVSGVVAQLAEKDRQISEMQAQIEELTQLVELATDMIPAETKRARGISTERMPKRGAA